MTKKIVLASNNAGKIREIQAMLAGLDVEILPQSAFVNEDAVENGASFVENALIKARHAALASGLPAIADDSGLEVDALGGAPGVCSARYAGENASDAANNAKLLREMEPVEDSARTARFRCAMAYVREAGDPDPVIVEAAWEGLILREPRGVNGFGYDPLFFVQGHSCTSAELPPAEKNLISHRGKALRALVKRLAV